MQIDCPSWADLDAFSTGIAFRMAVYDVSIRHCTSSHFIGCLAIGNALLVGIGEFQWTNLATISTVDTACRVYIAWLCSERDREIACLAFDVDDMGVGVYLNVWVLVIGDITG